MGFNSEVLVYYEGLLKPFISQVVEIKEHRNAFWVSI